jgi:hypothetical protein
MATNDLHYLPEAVAIRKDFPGWDAWASLIGGQWHARREGSTPPVMLHSDSSFDLREQIERYIARNGA